MYKSTADASTNERTFNSSGPDVKSVKFAPCKSAGISANVNGKPILGKTSLALSDFGYCAILSDENTTFYLEGDDDSDVYAFV